MWEQKEREEPINEQAGTSTILWQHNGSAPRSSRDVASLRAARAARLARHTFPVKPIFISGIKMV